MSTMEISLADLDLSVIYSDITTRILKVGNPKIPNTILRYHKFHKEDFDIDFTKVVGPLCLHEYAICSVLRDHPYVCNTYGYIDMNSKIENSYHSEPYGILQEYVESSLEDFLRSSKSLAYNSRKELLYKILIAYEFLNINRVTHGNIDIDNILVDENNNPKIINFISGFYDDNNPKILIYKKIDNMRLMTLILIILFGDFDLINVLPFWSKKRKEIVLKNIYTKKVKYILSRMILDDDCLIPYKDRFNLYTMLLDMIKSNNKYKFDIRSVLVSKFFILNRSENIDSILKIRSKFNLSNLNNGSILYIPEKSKTRKVLGKYIRYLTGILTSVYNFKEYSDIPTEFIEVIDFKYILYTLFLLYENLDLYNDKEDLYEYFCYTYYISYKILNSNEYYYEDLREILKKAISVTKIPEKYKNINNMKIVTLKELQDFEREIIVNRMKFDLYKELPINKIEDLQKYSRIFYQLIYLVIKSKGKIKINLDEVLSLLLIR